MIVDLLNLARCSQLPAGFTVAFGIIGMVWLVLGVVRFALLGLVLPIADWWQTRDVRWSRSDPVRGRRDVSGLRRRKSRH